VDYEAFQTEDISLEITSLTRVPEPLSLALCSLVRCSVSTADDRDRFRV